ncbi:hypothetical protein [Streptomyces sp. NPDC017086]|uniref:hypothetical protein n=1 Tax=Streptomyces sp. NPDC017086 TaxID=3364976 RepID=UPI0037964D59
MQITLQLGDTGEDIDVDLPAVPRIGEQILWTDEATDEHGTYDRMCEYRISMVDWSLSPGTTRPHILVRCTFLQDISGLPDKQS